MIWSEGAIQMRKTRFHLPALLCAGLALLPLAAPLACDIPPGAVVTDFDAKRMTKFDTSRDRGLAEAMQGENAEERAVLAAIFAGDAPLDAIPDGAYRCRTIKLGGLLPLVVYGYFDCTISGGGTFIEKRTGSQRFTGSLTPSGDSLFYAGALHYGDEQPLPYGADADRDQVGCLGAIAGAPGHYRLEMPAPRRESVHDVIELVAR